MKTHPKKCKVRRHASPWPTLDDGHFLEVKKKKNSNESLRRKYAWYLCGLTAGREHFFPPVMAAISRKLGTPIFTTLLLGAVTGASFVCAPLVKRARCAHALQVAGEVRECVGRVRCNTFSPAGENLGCKAYGQGAGGVFG